MPRSRRLRTSGLTAASAYLALAAASALTGGAMAIGLWLALSGALTAAVTLWAVWIVERPAPGDDGDGLGPDPEPEGEPPGWPEFERAFRDHASRSPEPV